MAKRRGGRMVSRILGKLRSRTLPRSREKGEYWAPSIRTGTIGASDLSATIPGPSNTFIRAPVTVIRPSGKMTKVRPSFTARTIALADIGLVGEEDRAHREEPAYAEDGQPDAAPVLRRLEDLPGA